MRAHIPIPRSLSVSVPSCISHWELPRAALQCPAASTRDTKTCLPSSKTFIGLAETSAAALQVSFSLHPTLPSSLPFECISQKCSPVSLMSAKIHPRVSQQTCSKTPSFWQFFAKNWHLFSTQKIISEHLGPFTAGNFAKKWALQLWLVA